MEGIKTKGYPLFKSKTLKDLFNILHEEQNVNNLATVLSKNSPRDILADLFLASNSINTEKAELSMKALAVILSKDYSNTLSSELTEYVDTIEKMDLDIFKTKYGEQKRKLPLSQQRYYEGMRDLIKYIKLKEVKQVNDNSSTRN